MPVWVGSKIKRFKYVLDNNNKMAKRGLNVMPRKDNKVLVIGLLVVFVIALVVLNFGRFTGSVTRIGGTTVKVEPETIRAGEPITISVVPGKKGTYNQYAVCDGDNDVCQAKPRMACGQFKCVKPVTDVYKTWANWEGIHYVKVFDYDTKEYVRAYFTIE